MVKFIPKVLLLLSLVSQGSASEPDVLLTFVGTGDEFNIYTITNEVSRQLPNWTPSMGREPLSVFDAAKKISDKYPGTRLDGISIRISRTNRTGREIWFYIFEVDPPKLEVVLMSGQLATVRTLNREEFFSQYYGKLPSNQ